MRVVINIVQLLALNLMLKYPLVVKLLFTSCLHSNSESTFLHIDYLQLINQRTYPLNLSLDKGLIKIFKFVDANTIYLPSLFLLF
jgi:hypothetical protein